MTQRFIRVLSYLESQGLIKNDTDFARIMGIPRTRVSDIRNGRRPVTAKFVLQLVSEFPCINKEYLFDESCETMIFADNETHVSGNGNFATNSHSFNTTDQSELVAQLRAENEHLKEQLAQARKDIEWLHDLVNALRSK